MKVFTLILAVLVTSLQSSMLAASSDTVDIKSLSNQVASLQQEIDDLKKTVESLKKLSPSIAMMMPNISERFHVMHFAADAEDWALAAHELLVLRGLVDRIGIVDPEKGALANGFLLGGFNQLEAAIEHQDDESFDEALETTVNSCNSCHVAVGSPFMKVVLDTTDSLSMRHSHALEKSEGGHKHTH